MIAGTVVLSTAAGAVAAVYGPEDGRRRSDGGPSSGAGGRPVRRPVPSPPEPSASAPEWNPERPEGRYFGISALHTPWSRSEIDGLAARAGKRPNLLSFFVKWGEDFRPAAMSACYRQGAMPMLTWEPWAGGELFSEKAVRQPDFALGRILEGRYDGYLEKFAEDVAEVGQPLVIRLAHEMNGSWFPWSEGRNGNRRGEYVRVWRHVRRIFDEAGAGNVIWHWSPNILRGTHAASHDLRRYYPGDEFVDWVGVTGYSTGQPTAAAVFDETLDRIREFADQPIVIAETGAKPGRAKEPWIKAFFNWLPHHPDVVGFVWFERSEKQGGTEDWRFAERPATEEAFRRGLSRVELAVVPVGGPAPV